MMLTHFNPQEFSIEQILFYLFCFGFLVQLWYYFGIFGKLAFYKKKSEASEFPPVSVVICARNEDDNLAAFLPLILKQDYPDFEVVVVNDCSWDGTADILDEFAKKHSNLRVVTIKEDENFSHGKKFAQMVGIKGAKNEHLLFTDADCKPVSSDWIKSMISEYSGNTEIILGYGAYEKTGGLLNKIIRFDTYYIALQYLSFSLAGNTYMGVGRNLSYKKSLFFRMKGFASHYHIESGDDDLFVNEAATKHNSKIQVNTESFTVSKVKRTWKGWLRQKRRHVTTAKYYNFGSKFRLGMLLSSQYIFFLSFIFLLIFHFEPYLILGIFCFRFFTQLLIFIKSMNKLQEKDLIYLAPFLEVFLMLFYPLLSLSNLFLKRNKWKG
jgi:poly-beta-1,6-N-acetyl-D-glucosamine synthase